MNTEQVTFLWVTDPWNSLDLPRDTTLTIASEAARKDFHCWWADANDITLRDSKVMVAAYPLNYISDPVEGIHVKRGELELRPAAFFSRIIYRVDPPVDLHYIQPLQLIHLATSDRDQTCSSVCPPEIVNRIPVLLACSEKLEGVLGDLSPHLVVSSCWELLSHFGTTHKRTVLKPLHTAQSKGVQYLGWTSSSEIERARIAIEEATDVFSRPVMLQEFLPGIVNGEIRLWFIDGDLLVSALKRSKEGISIIDMDNGGTLERHTLTARQREIVSRLSSHLKARRIRMAAIDLIDDKVTDFNFTSPGLLRQIEELYDTSFSSVIVDRLRQDWLD